MWWRGVIQNTNNISNSKSTNTGKCALSSPDGSSSAPGGGVSQAEPRRLPSPGVEDPGGDDPGMLVDSTQHFLRLSYLNLQNPAGKCLGYHWFPLGSAPRHVPKLPAQPGPKEWDKRWEGGSLTAIMTVSSP